MNLELSDTAWVVSKHSQEDESEEPDFGDSDSDVSAQQVRCDTRKTFYRSDCRLRYGYRGRPNLWRKTKKLWDRRHGFLAASKEALTPLDLCLFVKPPNLTSQKFHQHPCTLRLLLVWECSWSHLQTILKLKRDIVESSVLDVLRCFW